ncbi:MAG: HNH endonuclease [Salibacteraceae bacterium]
MIKSYWDEVWKEIDFGTDKLRYNYAISNYGRIVSYSENVQEGRLLKGSLVDGYPVFRYKQFLKTENGTKIKNKQIFVHKMVAEYFSERSSEEVRFVIHLDYNKLNNHIDNLRWATKREMEIHQQKNPNVLKAREKRKETKPYKGHKLNATQVKRLKKKIFDPNRKTRLKILAKQFGISEMQLYRIKSGENWSHVSIDD